MAAQILVTKFAIPPARANLVPRPGLIERLNAGLDHKLTLLSAPAGFGKTTLVSHWVEIVKKRDEINSQPIRVAWLSLDEEDNDADRFLTYFIASLKHIKDVDAGLGQGALSMLQSPQPPPANAILTSLINDLAVLPEKIIFVLDDYHLIESEPIHQALVFLLENLPLQMHLVIATRHDPHFPLGRLRARGQLIEIRAADLRFTSTEAADFLNRVMGLDLSPGDIIELENRTEGWIAGLQLAAISMQGHKDHTSFIKAFTGSNRLVLDYLVEDVLNQQSLDIQDFLMQTAILQRLTGSLCDALTGQDSGQAVLEKLERANLFIVPLDEERLWYRYHHLFADLLRQRLRRLQPDKLRGLFLGASAWFEKNGFEYEAIEYALRGEDFQRAAHLIAKATEIVWIRSEINKIQHWLSQLPVEIFNAKPQLCILHAWYLYVNGQLEEAEQKLQTAEKALDCGIYPTVEDSCKENNQPYDADTRKLLGRIAAVRSVLVFSHGDEQGTIQYAQEALELLPESDLTWRSTALLSIGDAYGFIGDVPSAYQARLEALEVRKAIGNVYMIMYAGLKLALILRDMGKLQQAQDVCEQQVELANNNGLSQTSVAGWSYILLGEMQAEKNELDKALEIANIGAELAQRDNDVITLSWSCLSLVKILFSRREFDQAEEIIQKMNRIALESDVPRLILNELMAWQARIWLAQGKIESAAYWVREIDLDIDGALEPVHDFDYVILARILIAQERLDEASKLLECLFDMIEVRGRVARSIEISILQALLFQAKNDTENAIANLKRAIALAEPEGYIRIFVNEGPPMASLLYQALNREISPGYVRRLLAAFPAPEPEDAVTKSFQVDQSALIEPLSDREIEVLQLVAKGLSNQVVATRLVLSVHTVKTHTRNIYSKLGVNNRTQAVDRARTLGILPPT